MRLDLIINQARRYFTRLNAPKSQVLKVALATLLALVIVSQLFFSGSSSSSSSPRVVPPKTVAVIKPGQTSNENYKAVPHEALQTATFAERCSKFFEGIQDKETSTNSEEYDTIASNSHAFSPVPEWEEWLEQKKKEAGKDFKEEAVEEWKKTFTDEAASMKALSDRFHTFFSNVRAYGACYVETNIFEELMGSSGMFSLLWSDEVNSELDETSLFHLSNDFGLKYFSWLSSIRPVYKKMGSKIAETGIPEIATSYESETVGKASFLYNFRQSLNGKGLVIPVKDKEDLENLTRMAKVLRFIGSPLPVQIVHDGYITTEFEQEITEAFTGTITHADFLTLKTIDLLPAGFDVNFSPLEDVWFVNIAQSVQKKYISRINRDDTFKTLALLFSSFEQGILVDPSVIPMRKLLSLLESDEFQLTGSYYFQDLLLNEDLSQAELRFLNQLFPTEVDEQVFGIPEVNDEKLAHTRMFGSGKSHAINNNVVALHKRDHFLGLLLALELQFMPISYEHKSLVADMLFIGPLAAGASKLYIHDIPPAIVGEFTQDENRKIKQSVSKEICSQHVAYLDSKDIDSLSVIFITSGCRNCDVMSTLDLEKVKGEALYRTLKQDTGKLKEWADKAVKFEGAIIPVAQEITGKNNIDEVEISLQNYGYCGDNIWCAYDILGAKDDAIYHGDVVEFDESITTTLQLISEVWLKF